MLFSMLGDDGAAPKYAYDVDKCKAEFQASTLKAADGKSLWDTGFRFTITYNTGNTARQSIAQILQQGISAVNDKFVIEATGLPWPTFLKNSKAKKLPLFIVGWQEDIPDTHNWTFTYGVGYDAANQNMPQAIKDILNPFITSGVHETDSTKRADIYKQFNQAYYDAAPSILMAQLFGRHYEQRWVHGYYNNPIYGNFYYYAFSKD
jgi:peptide/nickel transport system substrate-binding protein